MLDYSIIQQVQTFLKELMKKLVIGQNRTRVSLITFNNRQQELMNFTSQTSNEIVIDAIEKIVYRGGQTNTAEALRSVNLVVMKEENGMRPRKEGIPKVVLTITDGLSDNPAETSYQARLICLRAYNAFYGRGRKCFGPP